MLAVSRDRILSEESGKSLLIYAKQGMCANELFKIEDLYRRSKYCTLNYQNINFNYCKFIQEELISTRSVHDT